MTGSKVVVIDDEPETVRLLKAFLELFDYEVVGAFSGASGLNAVREHKPDALLLDLMLPDADGYEICRELRNQSDTQTLPIIMITARVSKAETERGYKAGATVYLKKPLDLNKLVKEVEEAIKRGHHAPPPPEKQSEDAATQPSKKPSQAGVIVVEPVSKREPDVVVGPSESSDPDDLETRPIPGQYIQPAQRSKEAQHEAKADADAQKEDKPASQEQDKPQK